MSGSAILPLYYAPIPPHGSSIELDGAEGVHAVRVRRTRVGERLRIADGAGSYVDCTVAAVTDRTLSATIDARGSVSEPSPRILVAQAVPKGDRATLAVELLTECGVDAIIPWQARNCVARWADQTKATKGVAKWSATAYAAAKQSRRVRIPRVLDPVDTADLIGWLDGRQGIVLHESATDRIDAAALAADTDVLLIVGPEGGIAPAELEAFQEAGAQLAGLGPEVLRTSTAGGIAAALIAAGTGRWAWPIDAPDGPR